MALEKVDYSKIRELEWDEFCIQSHSAWFQHTTEWIKYTVEMYGKNNCKNESFAILEDNKILALAVAVISINKSLGEKDCSSLTMAGFPTVYPAFENSLSLKKFKTVEKYIMEKIFEIENINQYQIYISPLIQENLEGNIRCNPLNKFGFHDTSISTNIIDISKGIEKLFKNLYKGCRADVNHALKNENLSTSIIDRKNYEEEIFIEFKKIHLEAASRKTRSDNTWDIQKSWIKKGLAILGVCQYKNKIISAVFINKYKNNCYYQVGATLPDYIRMRGVGQLLQWMVIEYLIQIKASYYEIGWNWYGNFTQEIADDKMLTISSFKRSFGGDIYSLLRGEKFKLFSTMEKEYIKRLATYKTFFN